MGNCAIKPKVLKDSEEDLVPVERETVVVPADGRNNKDPADQKAADEAAARRSDKGKEILIEDEEDKHHKRPSLAHLFHEDKTVLEKEVADLSPPKRETNSIIGPSSEVSKLDTFALTASNVKVPEESFDVRTRNDLEVKIPKDSKVKTPENPKAKKAEEKWSRNLEVHFPVELEAKKTPEVIKVGEELKLPEVDKVSAPQLSELEVTKESSVPEVLEDNNIPKDSEVSVPELSVIKDKRELNVPEAVTEDKDIPEVSKVKAGEVEVAESELLKVSEVESTEDLEVKVPKIFEVKSSETPNINVKNESEVKTDQEALKANIEKEIEVPEFKDAQEKLPKSDEDKEIVLPNTEEETKDVSLEKQVKESTALSDLGNK